MIFFGFVWCERGRPLGRAPILCPSKKYFTADSRQSIS